MQRAGTTDKSADLIFLERQYTRVRWGNEFDMRHKPKDWAAFATKELYAHRDAEGANAYLWPGRKSDLSLILALTGTAATLVSHLEAEDRRNKAPFLEDGPLRHTRAVLEDIRKLDREIPRDMRFMNPNGTNDVNERLFDLNSHILSAYSNKDPELINQVKLSLVYLMRTMDKIEQRNRGLISAAIPVTHQRLVTAIPHPATREDRPARKSPANAMVRQFKPTERDFREVGEQLTQYTLSKGGPDYKPRHIAFRAKVGERTVGQLLATHLWGRMEVDLFFVSEKHRGQGIGSQLLIAAEEFARRKHIGGIQLWTPDWQGGRQPGQSESFYEKHGYKLDADRPYYLARHYFHGHGHDRRSMVYSKELKAA